MKKTSISLMLFVIFGTALSALMLSVLVFQELLPSNLNTLFYAILSLTIIILIFLQMRLNHKYQALQASQKSAKVGSWDWDIKNKQVHLSDTVKQLIGYKENKNILTDAEFLSLLYKPDKKSYIAALKKSYRSGEPFRVELRCESTKSYKPWLKSIGETQYDPNNQPVRMIGMMQDVSDAVIHRKMQNAMKGILTNIIEHEELYLVLEKICTAISEIEPSLHCVFFLASSKEQHFELHHSATITDSLKLILNSITIEDGHSELAQTLNQTRPLYIEDLNNLPNWQSAHQISNSLSITAYYGQTLFCTNIYDNQTVQGAISLYLEDSNIPSEITYQILDTALRVAEVAIDGKLQSDRKLKIQQQLYHSQKMDSIGHLTGGIAHDFNNILGSIVGYNSLAKKITLKDNDQKLTHYLNEVSTAAERARELISQMMIFSRSEPSKNISTDIRPVIKEVLVLIKAMIPASITINYHFDKEIKNINVNPIALHQVVMNLLINAKDSIESTVGYINVTLIETEIKHSKCVSCHQHFEGYFVCLDISDNGHGIASELLDKIFDPFFTTKEIGRGSGMGLSVVHGILHEINGHIDVQSDSKKGTQIKLYFPTLLDEEKSDRSDLFVTESSSSVGHGEHIMVVDDDVPLSLLFEEILVSYGYNVSRFDNSQVALEDYLSEPSKYNLILSDQTMPFLTGDEMAKKMLSVNATLPIIICTGYSEILNEKLAKEIGICALLEKPVDMYKLLELIDLTLQSN